MSLLAEKLLQLEWELCENLKKLDWPAQVNVIYSPIEYASQPHRNFVFKYCVDCPTGRILFLGMNPGPFGMVQTGVPFGDVEMTLNWLAVSGHVETPLTEHPKRRVTGFASRRVEISGSRFWSFIKMVCKTPDIFFQNCFVHNFCPFAYLSESGKNLTPSDLPSEFRNKLNECCIESLAKVSHLLNVKLIIGIGRYACNVAKKMLKQHKLLDIKVEFLLHPSPRNCQANKGWAELAWKRLSEMNVISTLPDNQMHFQYVATTSESKSK